MHRFYVQKEQIKDNEVQIVGSDVNHIKNVLRLKAGDKIEIFDGSQNNYFCEIKELNREFIRGTIITKKKAASEPNLNLTLAQCLAKGKKMDLIVKMATELGARSIVPVISERSVPRIEEKGEKKIEHWQNIAREAAEQSGRTFIPRIESLKKISDLNPGEHDLAVMPWEGETKTSLKKLLTGTRANGRTDKLMILIGPEGGFSRSEADCAKKAGFKLVSMGKRILRCETAAIAALAQIFYELEA